jgi:aminoglycoside phosphotransferase (APT) family kinase protein
MTEVPLTGGGRTSVTRGGDVVYRAAGPWSPAVIALLRHLEAAGFDGAPRVVGTGFDAQGRETLSFVPGASLHPYAWPEDAMAAIGALLRRAHDASRGFVPPADARWRPWFGRALGSGPPVFGHCDTGQWNIIARDDQPVALIDWEQAGPVDPLVDLAQTAWLNAHLFDDDLAESLNLPSAADRARRVGLLFDGYGLDRSHRSGVVDLMIAVAVMDTAREAEQAQNTTPEDAVGAMTWRARSAAWMMRNRSVFDGV